MSSFLLNLGLHLQKKKIEYYVEWALDATAYKEFRVVELDPSAKIEVTYYDKNKKKRRNEVFPYNRKKVLLSQIYQSILKTLDST